MKGLAVATLLAISFSGSICFSQLSEPNSSGLAGRNGSISAARSSNLSGVVIGSDGTPILDARIELRNERTSNTAASGYTNANGAFEFANLPSGHYEVVATQGIAEAHERVDLEGPVALKMQLNNSDRATAQADGRAMVSVAEYKVPQKARDALHKAEAALSKNRPEETRKHLAKALEIYPDYAAALTLRGVLSLDHSDIHAAIEDLDKAIHCDPNFSLAYTAMAAALNQLKQFDDALRSADRAITLAPRSWQSYFEMAKAYVGKAEYQHALQQLTRAQGLSPKDYGPIHLVRAHVMLALQEYNSAMNELQAFLTLAPQDPNSAAARDVLEKVKAFTAAAANPPPMHAAR